jgi:hypothetical protein
MTPAAHWDWDKIVYTPQLPYRQIHLDFHTSEWCQNVGAAFDGEAFARTLVDARVQSINLFAKCHHGYSYYPTTVGTPHPHLKTDLLGDQIEALHRHGIRCPIYVSVMWDELASQQHPEWLMVDKEGHLINRPPLSNDWGWATLDVSSGYGDYVLAQVEELFNRYEVDGIWLDICFALPNYSPWAKAQMRAAGINIADEAAVWEFARRKQTDFFQRMTTYIHQRQAETLVFYNGTMLPDMRRVIPHMTHLEVESLPTTGQWGYLHYPLLARQARTYGKPFLGMNGRFHRSWGDFGGLKTRDQLEYECGTILAAGGKICVGDQLHPSGQLDAAIYRLIGQTFRRVEALEPWLIGAQPVAEIGVLAVTRQTIENPGIGAYTDDVEGAAQMLLELGYQFNLVDVEADFSPYAALIVADATQADDKLLHKLNEYLTAGGKLILSGTALLGNDGTFQLSAIPVHYRQPAPTVPNYLRPDAALAVGSELATDYDYAFYGTSHLVQPIAEAVAHGHISRALFNRTWEHFMGHQHAPVGDSLDAPVLVQGEQVLYFAAPLFSGYRQQDYWAYRAMAAPALRRFLPAQRIQPTAPGWVECSLHEQPADDSHPARQIVHVVCYQPRRTFQPIQHVDQAGLAAGITLRVQAPEQPDRVYLAPDETDLSFIYADGVVQIALPPVAVHTVVVME